MLIITSQFINTSPVILQNEFTILPYITMTCKMAAPISQWTKGHPFLYTSYSRSENMNFNRDIKQYYIDIFYLPLPPRGSHQYLNFQSRNHDRLIGHLFYRSVKITVLYIIVYSKLLYSVFNSDAMHQIRLSYDSLFICKKVFCPT